MATGDTLTIQVTRRGFLRGAGTAGLGLVLGFHFDLRPAGAAEAAGPFAPNAFVRVAPDDTVTVIAKHLEMGQGTYTGLATILADELDAAWSQVRVESAPADVTRYANLGWGIQGTGGSSAMNNSWDQLRSAGATARAMLVDAAATRWGAPHHEVSVDAGVVRHAASGRHARFGELAGEAAARPVPESVALKDPSRFRLIGARVPRVDSADKAAGKAEFGMDKRLPGMLTAVLARSPRFGGTLAGHDAAAALAVPGVVGVHPLPAAVAVLATSFWAARQGREALRCQWNDAAAETRGSEEILEAYRQLAATPGATVLAEGDVEAALGRAKVVLEAEYAFPYLAHAPMEPLNATLQVGEDGADVWMGSQLQTVDQQVVAATLGLAPEKVRIHTMLAGGSFGRRATPVADLAGEVAAVAKASGRKEPIRLIWTREDELAGGRYRPLTLTRARIGIDAAGKVSGWHHRIVSQSLLAGTPFAGGMKDGIDRTSIEGASEVPYQLGARQVELHTPSSPVTVLWWRSVGHTTNGYSMETLIDEVATALHRDPVALRLELLRPGARERRVLEVAAERAGWGRQLPAGRAHGVAVHASFGSFVAQVAEVSVGEDALPRVHRVTCAVDCGRALNPHNIEAQMQSGIGFALAAALYGEISLEGGVPRQRNFHEYRTLRLHEMPEVEVHVIPSEEKPTGVGEPGVPPLAPAVANAWFRLTGERVRRLPFARGRS